MNKLRKSLGLPLLGGAQADPESATDNNGLVFKSKNGDGEPEEEAASTLETREAAGYANFKALQDEEKKRIEREQRKKALQRARDVAERAKKLEGRGLGDADEDEAGDAKSWLKGQSKRQKAIEKERARKLEEELAERERLAAIEYTSEDLKGVQVAHELGDFDDGNEDQILTLADREIGKDDEDEEGDVLENADLIARDNLKARLDAKKKIVYDVHDDDEKGLLAQYDDKKRKAFTLDGQGSSIEQRESKRQQIGEKLKNTISLDMFKVEPVSDYQEIKMKKPKKSKKKNLRQKEVDEDDVFPSINGMNGSGDAMDVDNTVSKPRTRTDTDFNDDEDLSSALNFSRRTALKKKKLKPEDIARQLREEEEEAETPDLEGGIVLDDTTNFLDNLEARPREERPQPKQRSVEPKLETADSPADEDHVMEESNEAYAVVEGDEEALLDNIKRTQAGSTINTTGLEEEQKLDTGIGAALSLLKSRGIVKETDHSDRNALYRDRQKFITEARLREHDAEQRARNQRERDRLSGKNQGLSTREREEKARWQNEQRAQQSSIAAAAAFNKEYKPDVNIKYVDDDGRVLNQKEAFKHLSHQFHGKGSGKQKTEKHIKKVEDEKRREAKSVLDNSSDDRGMQRAQGTMTKRDKIAGVRLG